MANRPAQAPEAAPVRRDRGDTRRGHVAVVTDSTAYLPRHLAEHRSIRVVPLHVVIDGRSLLEGAQAGPSDVARALRQRKTVSTSRPSPRALLSAYEACADAGAAGVVSVHLSGKLSGTLDAARLAAQDSPVPVTVLDSESVGMGLGFAVCTAADASARGLTQDEVADAASARAAHAATLFMVDSLEYLRRGGRVKATSAMLGTALSIKPVLELRDGAVAVLDKVRTTSRAVDRLATVGATFAGQANVDIAVHHLDNLRRGEDLADRLRDRIPYVRDLVMSEVGAVIGAHIGPGALGVVISPRA